MTNAEIIMQEKILNNIDVDVTVNTFAGWKRNGKQVKRGEKAVFITQIWKPSKRKPKEDEDENEEHRGMYLVKAAFFTESQVEDIKEENNHDNTREDD